MGIDQQLNFNHLAIELSDSPSEAPSYKLPEHRLAKLVSARIVGRGTVNGEPTVDLIFEDENGQKFVAMKTGNIMIMLADAVKGMQARTRS
jgi:hypothetical protein